MRLDRAIIVAKKDLSEFAKNKYIMMTIVMMPLVASVILPIVYVVPINQLSRQSSADLNLHFQITLEFNNVTLTDATLIDTRLDHVVLSNCIVRRFDFALNVRTDDGRILVNLDDPEERNPVIVEALTRAGAKIEYVTELKRSLEDVYMKLIGGGVR